MKKLPFNILGIPQIIYFCLCKFAPFNERQSSSNNHGPLLTNKQMENYFIHANYPRIQFFALFVQVFFYKKFVKCKIKLLLYVEIKKSIYLFISYRIYALNRTYTLVICFDHLVFYFNLHFQLINAQIGTAQL